MNLCTRYIDWICLDAEYRCSAVPQLSHK